MIRKVLFVMALLAATMTGPAAARISVQNFMSGETAPATNGLQVYEYDTGTPVVSDFDTGTLSDAVSNSGVLELSGGGGGDWWDADWTRRQCFDVTSTAALAEYAIEFDVDTTGTASNGDDIRVVVGQNGALLNSYSEGPFVSTASVVWAQIAPLPAGVSTYCVYFDNSAAVSVSDELAVFESTTPTNYYAMTNSYTGSTSLQVVSYYNGNTVSDGTTSVVLNAGQTHTFAGANQNTVITATAPIEGSADVNAVETIVPEGFASNDFVFGVNRRSNQVWVRAPFGATTIETSVNGVVTQTVPVAPADGAVVISSDFGNGEHMRVRSTDGTDFLAVFKTTTDTDVGIAMDNRGETVHGVTTKTRVTAAIGSANVTVQSSDDVPSAFAVGAAPNYTGGGGNRGLPPGESVTSDGAPISVYQYADTNGSEVTAFYPTSLLTQTWRIPISSSYISVVCPTMPTNVVIDGTAVACSSTGGGTVGHAYGGQTVRNAGALVTADNPVYVMYESRVNSDEHNVLGIRGSQPYLQGISAAADVVEILAGGCGTWESPVLATSGVFGQTDIVDSVPPGATAVYQISTDGSPFYGPDGTATSSFSTGDIVPYVADFASTIQLRIELCAASAGSLVSVDSFSVDNNLVELVGDHTVTTGVTLPSSPSPFNEPVLRIYQANPGAWIGSVEYDSGTNLGALNADIDTDHPSTQIIVAGGGAMSPSPTFSHTTAEPYSVYANHDTAAGQTAEVVIDVVALGQGRVESSVRLTFVG